jgi:hypothetical protein
LDEVPEGFWIPDYHPDGFRTHSNAMMRQKRKSLILVGARVTRVLAKMGDKPFHMSIDPIIPLVLLSVARTNSVQQKQMSENPPYRTDLINAAMGARRLTNKTVAEKAGVGVMTVSRIRNGDANVSYIMLKKVVEALGLTVEISEKNRLN